MFATNLAKRARKAIGLSQAKLARLLGVKQPLLSKWEGGSKMSKLAVTLMKIIEREPEAALRALKADGATPGYAGDGGPPPQRTSTHAHGPMVDEHGFVMAEGERPEEGLGFDAGELDLPEADFEFDEDDPLAYRPVF